MTQNLFGTECHPAQTSDPFDATLEEVLHITTTGYAITYPSAFGTSATTPSRLTKAMDVARGGHFTKIPKNYPTTAWYRYKDKTCIYKC